MRASWATEGRAGVATFLTMSYILFVNPAILSVSYPNDDRTSSVCSPSRGPSHRVAPGVSDSLGTMPGTFSGLPSGNRAS